MKKIVTALIIVSLTALTQAKDYKVKLSRNDTFNVIAFEDGTLSKEVYKKNNKAHFMLSSPRSDFLVLMTFLNEPNDESSKTRMKDRVLITGQNHLSSALEAEIDLENSYGFYYSLTDKNTAKKKAPKPTDFLHLTDGSLRLSDDSILNFTILTHKGGEKLKTELMKYIMSYVK